MAITLRLLPEMQNRVDTSATSRAVGKAIGDVMPDGVPIVGQGVSGAKLDAAAQAILGGLSEFLLLGTDMVLDASGVEDARPPVRLERMPVVKSFYKDSRTMTTKWTEEYYDLHTEVDKVYGSIREARQMGEFARSEALLKDNKALISMRAYVNAMGQKLGAINRLIEENTLSDKPREEKRELEVELIARKNKVLKKTEAILEKIEKGEVD